MVIGTLLIGGFLALLGYSFGIAGADEELKLLAVLSLVLAAALGGLAYDYQRTVDSARQVEGTIIDAEEAYTDCDDSGCTVGLDVNYNYTVDGTMYTSQTVFYAVDNPREADETRAASVLSSYEPGDNVTVYVHSDNAYRSGLKTDLLRAIDIPLMFLPGLVFMIGGWVLRSVGPLADQTDQ